MSSSVIYTDNLKRHLEELLDFFDTSTSPYSLEVIDSEGNVSTMSVTDELEDVIDDAQSALYDEEEDYEEE